MREPHVCFLSFTFVLRDSLVLLVIQAQLEITAAHAHSSAPASKIRIGKSFNLDFESCLASKSSKKIILFACNKVVEISYLAFINFSKIWTNTNSYFLGFLCPISYHRIYKSLFLLIFKLKSIFFPAISIDINVKFSSIQILNEESLF